MEKNCGSFGNGQFINVGPFFTQTLHMYVKVGKKVFLKSYIGHLIHQLTHIADSANSAEFHYAFQLSPQKDNVQFQKLFFLSSSIIIIRANIFFQESIFP